MAQAVEASGRTSGGGQLAIGPGRAGQWLRKVIFHSHCPGQQDRDRVRAPDPRPERSNPDPQTGEEVEPGTGEVEPGTGEVEPRVREP
jgi:hypothetical protein